jgi:Casein kinase II regulatory subunit
MDRPLGGGATREDVTSGRSMTPASIQKRRPTLQGKTANIDIQQAMGNASESSTTSSSTDTADENDHTDGVMTEEEEEEEEAWMVWFLRLPGHHLYVSVPETFLRDDFHMTDLATKVPYYKAALALLLNEPLPCKFHDSCIFHQTI